jgi:hypothetical protein
MSANDLQAIADAAVRRAEQQGSLLPREVRALLVEAGHDATLWRDVLDRTPLRKRGTRYYPPGSSDRARREHEQQRAILKAIRQMIRLHRAATHQDERRGQVRTDFIQPVRIRTEDGRECTLVSRDVSATGIRLLGTRRLLGQRVRVFIPQPGADVASTQGWTFVVRILWTCAIGEDLFENGGAFLDAEAH